MTQPICYLRIGNIDGREARTIPLYPGDFVDYLDAGYSALPGKDEIHVFDLLDYIPKEELPKDTPP